MLLYLGTSEKKRVAIYGGIAQLARASGSYPAGRWFKSDFRYQESFEVSGGIWPVGQAVKTRPFHGCNMGSIPVRVTKNPEYVSIQDFYFFTFTS